MTKRLTTTLSGAGSVASTSGPFPSQELADASYDYLSSVDEQRPELHQAVPATGERRLVLALSIAKVASTTQLTDIASGEVSATTQRLTRRRLARLRQAGQVERLVDRSRDRRTGAQGYLHRLTAAGARIAGSAGGPGVRQRRSWRPSTAFLEHRLAITDVWVALAAAERRKLLRLQAFQSEPDSWPLTGSDSDVRPDAAARLVAGGFEVSWFIEVDRGTQSPRVIARKCQAYRRWELVGDVQRRRGVFPGVVFVAPDQRRAAALWAVIVRQPAEARGLYTTTTTQGLVDVLMEVTP